MMEFEVLGPVRVRAGGQPTPLTARMPRTLLAILLTRVNTSVPVDMLVDTLWAGKRDPRAGKKLQLHIHRLRRTLGDRLLGDRTRIRFEYGGYTLRLQPGELDAQRFETMLAESSGSGDPARSARLLRTALGLWRADPFGGVADVPLVRAEIDRLTELRLVALEELYAAELACGQGGLIVPELGELATRHPLRERLQGLLMTALYQGGRRAEALGVYRRTRSALIDELAVEPGPELRRVEHAVLTGDPVQRIITATPPVQLPPAIVDFTGRDAQLAVIAQHLLAGADRSGMVPVTAITGMPGVGKTALAVRAAHQLRPHFPHGQLYVDLRGAQAQPLDAAQVLGRFLRALGVDPTAVPHDVEEGAALYRSRLANRRLLILLDNAADEHQLRPLLPAMPGCAVLITSRSRLVGLSGAHRIELDVLEPDQAVELLAWIAGPQRVADELAAAEEIVRLCGCLPLAVRVAGLRLGARPHWRLARLAADLADEHRRLDELAFGDLAVRASLALSYQGLAEPARKAFRHLGLLAAPDFPVWVCAALLDIPQSRAEDLLDTLVDAQLLDITGPDDADGPRYRCHDLLRIYAKELFIAQEPMPDRLAALKRIFGSWLSELHRGEARAGFLFSDA